MEDMISIIMESIFTVLGVLIAACVTYVTPKLKEYFKAKADQDNSGVIGTVIDMGVELAEKELGGEAGDVKFRRAMIFASDMLNRYGIQASDEFLSGAVQSGWRRMNEKQKGDR